MEGLPMEERPFVPINHYFRACNNPELEKEIARCKEVCFAYNKLSPNARTKQREILEGLLGSIGENVMITPPFWCDYGYNIHIGNDFYANHNLIITDGAKVVFGDNVFVGPNCCFTTAEHSIDPEQRRAGIEVAKPIVVGNNVWIGAGAIILAGTTIGDNTVIGAGSVVKGTIPGNVVAAGVPCRVIREITAAEKTRYPMYEGNEKDSGD